MDTDPSPVHVVAALEVRPNTPSAPDEDDFRVVDAVDAVPTGELTYGRVSLFSEPWANIYLEGRKIGVTPVRYLRLRRGRHRLTLVNPVLDRRATVTVTVPAPGPYRVLLDA